MLRRRRPSMRRWRFSSAAPRRAALRTASSSVSITSTTSRRSSTRPPGRRSAPAQGSQSIGPSRTSWKTTGSCSSSVRMSGSIRTSRCAGSGSSSSTWRRPIPIGKNGGRATRRAPTGTTARGCSVISPRMWPETAISARAEQCENSSPNSAGSPGPRVQRKILNEVGCSHQQLASFFGIDQVNRDGIARLLAAMQRHSKPVAPQHLGIIGAGHFKPAVPGVGRRSRYLQV